MRPIQPPRLPQWQPYVFFKEPELSFSEEECETIIHIAKTIRPEPAKTGSNENAQQDPKIRVSELRWMTNKKASWVFEKLERVCAAVRQGWYPFQLSGFPEPLQVTRYRASAGAHYDWHQDFGPETMSTRKLSLVALLSDPQYFKGGELEILGRVGSDKKVEQLERGTIVAFPSWEFHRVLPVTEGERWSLVSWVHGEPFR